MSFYIQEHLYDKEKSENLINALHETLHPLSALCRELYDSADGDSDLALVMEVLLDHAYKIQETIVSYIESKIGKVAVVYNSNSKSVYRASMYITGLKD